MTLEEKELHIEWQLLLDIYMDCNNYGKREIKRRIRNIRKKLTNQEEKP